MGRGTRTRVLGAVLAASCVASALTTASAKADDHPPKDATGDVVVPPRLLGAVQAGYPEGAEGSASVMVGVTVGAEGNVQDARVLEGAEPFAQQALEAVRSARFVPATRGGRPIAATIRFRVDFAKAAAPEPVAPLADPAPVVTTTGVAEPADAPPAPPLDPPGVVLVRGGKAAAGAPIADTLARTEVRQLPGAFGDPFRALEVAPGVTPIVSGLPYFYVRGAPPGNVGYYFDGVRVPYLFHFGLGPGVIQPSLVARTDIHKGGYPAALGRFAGGIVDAAATAPATEIHGEAQLRIIDGGGVVEAPFANGRGAALVGGRYSYTSALFSLLDAKTSLDYRDYQARVSYALGEDDSISLLVFGAYDRATQRTTPDRDTIAAATGNAPRPTDAPREIEIVLFASEFHRADLRWDHALRGGGHMRVATTVGFDRTRLEARRAAEDLMTAARFELEQPIGKRVLVRGGADVVVDRYHADSLPLFSDDDDVVARQEKIFAERTDFATGLHLDAVLGVTDRIEVTPGVRLDVYGSDHARAVGIDPRLTARFFVNDKVRIVHAYGLVTQPPSTPIALPAATIARLEGGLQRAAQTSAGVEVDLPSDVSASVTAFHQAFYDLNDALGTSQVEIVDIEKSDALVGKTRGSAYGLEVGVRRKLSRRVGGFLSYTLSRSERHDGGRTYLSSYDRPHVLNLALSVDLGRHWRAGGRFVFYTGGPQYPEAPDYAGQRVGVPPSRAPDFVRLDARLEKRWSVGARGYVSFVVEALNATLSTETTGYRCQRQLPDPGSGRPAPQCYARTFGPVSIPSIGLEGGF
ncbi:MAG: tonB family protein [Labilithrix sp.]|nr:tonB family protein [Labilithrix sp.]